MEEKTLEWYQIIVFLMGLCIFVSILINIIKFCYQAINKVTQHPGTYLLLITIAAAIFICIIVQVEMEKQHEIERQRLLKKQREQELYAMGFFIFTVVVIIILIYKGICYLLTPHYNITLQQQQFDINMHIQRNRELQERNDDIWKRYRNWDSSQDSYVPECRTRFLLKNQKRQTSNEVYEKRQLASSYTSNLFSLEELNSKDWQIISQSFSNKKFSWYYQINKVRKLYNVNLLDKYNKQKLKYFYIYGNQLQEIYLFHGTTPSALDSICTHNFDMKKVKNVLYGWGISFANNPYYASHYSTKHCNDENCVMILAKVLVGRKQIGYEGQMFPSSGFDTTTNNDGQVVVKYDKDTFYPEFIVYFSRK